MAERYGLFTIIVLGEGISAGTIAVQAASSTKTSFGHLATIMVGGLLIVFSMWWLYFDMPSTEIAASVRRSFTTRLNGAFRWGYGHYVVFASVAATGAGLALAVDDATRHYRARRCVPGRGMGPPRPVQTAEPAAQFWGSRRCHRCSRLQRHPPARPRHGHRSQLPVSDDHRRPHSRRDGP